MSRLRRFLSLRKTRWRRWVIGALFLPVLVLVGLLALRGFTQRSIARNTRITSPDGIESLEAVSIGGVTQWLLIRGQDRRNPVLLFLHGGPGSASMALSPKHDTPLLRHFTVVHWDQRGAGKSFGGVSPESLTVERFIADIREVVIHLRQRLGADPVYLVGHSWGSKIGALAAARFPELFEAFVGVGQAVKLSWGEHGVSRKAWARPARAGFAWDLNATAQCGRSVAYLKGGTG